MTRTLAAAALMALAACAPRPAGHPPETAQLAGSTSPGVVDGRTAVGLAGAGARIVDVRTPEEFAAGHVAGALNVPFDELARRAGEIGGPETPVVVYCRSGRRSAVATKTLRGLGYGQVWDAQRYDAWPREAAGGR